MTAGFRQVEITRVRDGRGAAGMDSAATEEPLEVRLHGRPFAVIMRTPGADRELAAGFLFSEQVVRSTGDLERVGSPGALLLGPQNVVDVTLANASADGVDRILAGRRNVTTNSSCGLCGRVTIESLRADAPPLESSWTVRPDVLQKLPDRLRAAQSLFDETGGLHAAGLFTPDGRLDAVAEDVGRHNAVDKVVGAKLLADALPLSTHVLFVSGRTSFEIVQKAFLAGIPLVGAVSAPSSLAIDLAEESGVTLVGFLRGGSFNIYAHPERVAT